MDVLLTLILCAATGLYLLRLEERRYDYENSLEQENPA